MKRMVKALGESVKPDSKVCTKCGVEKGLDEFYRDKRSRDGRYSSCKTCETEKHKIARRRRKRLHLEGKLSIVSSKKCGACGETKQSSKFYKDLRQNDGLKSECKRCHLTRSKQCHAAARKTPRGRSVALVASARTRAKRYGCHFDIHWTDIVSQIEVGLCELSGLPFDMESDGRSPFSPSIDRIIPELGYVKGNTRVVLWGINAMIGDWGQSVFEEIAYRHLLHARPDLVIQQPRRRKHDNDNQLSLFEDCVA